MSKSNRSRKSSAGRDQAASRAKFLGRRPGFESLEPRQMMAVDIPFSILTQNTQLRPSSVWEADPDHFARTVGVVAALVHPFAAAAVVDTAAIAVDIYSKYVPNTAEDNAERADAVFGKAETYDIVALQEVFDPDQVHQLRSAANGRGYGYFEGPGHDSVGETLESTGFIGDVIGFLEDIIPGPEPRLGWTSGLSTLVRDVVGEVSHSAVEFEEEGSGIDPFANKGFTVDLIDMGSGSVYVINTHLTASDEGAKIEQLRQISNHVATLDARFPVILVGDLNVPGESATRELDESYHVNESPGAHWRIKQLFPDFVDPFHDAVIDSNSTSLRDGRFEADNYAQQFWTADPSSNAFKYFAKSGDTSYKDRIDHILVRPGSEWGLDINSIRLENQSVATRNISERLTEELLRINAEIVTALAFLTLDSENAQAQEKLQSALVEREVVSNLQPYLSDHFGLGANLNLYRYIDFDESTGILRLKGAYGEVEDEFSARRRGDELVVTHSFGANSTQVVIPYGQVRSITGYGRGGNDTFFIDASVDIATHLEGGSGDDTIYGGSGNDTIYGQAGNDALHGGAGADLIDGQGGADSIDGQAGNDRVFGGSEDDRLIGGAEDDQLFGGTGNDRLLKPAIRLVFERVGPPRKRGG